MFMICKQSVIHLITILLLFNCVYAQNPSIKKPNGSVLLPNGKYIERDSVESSLQTIHDIATENLGTVCLTKSFCRLKVPLNVARYEGSRQKADLVALVLQDIGFNRHGNNIQLSESLSKGILSDESITGTRILTLNATDGHIITTVWWIKTTSGTINLYEDDGLRVGMPPNTNYPWFEVEDAINSIRSSKFIKTAPADSFKGFWTFPYYVCNSGRWIISYSVFIPSAGKYGVRGLLSVDIDVTHLQVNQCELLMAENKSVSLDLSKRNPEPTTTTTTILYQEDTTTNQIEAFHNSHKCHRETMQCDYRPFTGIAKKNQFGTTGWIRGAYQCLCRPGYYSLRHPQGFNGTIMEMAYQEYLDNISNYFIDAFQCIKCAPGCDHCTNGDPCLASYNWIFRFTILFISIMCATSTFIVAFYMYRHRKVKVFKVASPTFLLITLLGCAIMYLEMAAIFPILDTYSCIATKWTRHFGFCITYTSLLMKTWRVSLTYRVKSAHKVKLTDKQLLQWMVPILLVMLIYLSTWTLSATPVAVVITDQDGLKFKQCSYNWWDHSLAIGEVLFLAWGIRVCYNVRNAESLYNEAKLISYAIYNIAIVNITMISFHLFIFPKAGPDIKYLLGFIRTQLSTSTTIALVFGPKVLRVIRGQGDQWDQRARLRGVTASFSFNGNGLVAEDPPDLYIENEELKEEIQKLAAQMEFMKIVHMEINNRHLNPKPGGYFSASKHGVYKALAQQARKQSQQNSGVSDNGHSASNSIGTNSIG